MLIGKNTRKRRLGKARHRWEDNIIRIIANLKEIFLNTRIWINWVQDRDYCRALVNGKLNLRVSYAIKMVNRLQ